MSFPVTEPAALEALIARVESLDDLRLDRELLGRMAGSGLSPRPIDFHLPGFRRSSDSELAASPAAWPAISITGAECRLRCDHCGGRILEPMIPAPTPERLWQTVERLVADGVGGMLLTGGSNRANEVEYAPFLPTLRRIRDHHPDFRIAVHTGLVDREAAQGLARAGVDTAMLDLIGAQETVTRVYHLKRRVADFEASLAALVAAGLRVVPHIVMGLHYGELLGEREALEMVVRQRPAALVLVAAMPHLADPRRPFRVPDAEAVGAFLLHARRRLPDLPLLLGCARPPGAAKVRMDAYAVLAGLDGIAHPSAGMVELATRLGRPVRAFGGCCSVANDAAGGRELVKLDIDQITEQERGARTQTLGGIPVVAGGGRAA